MLVDIIWLLGSLLIILLASVLFTNAIEVLGQRLGMHQGAVGSILAAVGTALPETVIPLIAILWIGDAQSKDVAIGAIAGAPFMLGTLAFFVTGAAVVIFSMRGRRPREMSVDVRVTHPDLGFFLVLYGLAVLATFVHDYMPARIGIAVVLVGAYAVYVRVTLRSEAAELEDVEALWLTRLLRVGEHMPLVVVQLVGSLVIMVWGGHLFVKSVELVSELAGLSPLVLSLLITPIATELPEKFNSVIWVWRGKDTLALGNITGAMVFQASFPVAFGVVGTPWRLMDNHGVTMVSAVLALVGAGLVWLMVWKHRKISPWALMIGGGLYTVFLVYVLTHAK